MTLSAAGLHRRLLQEPRSPRRPCGLLLDLAEAVDLQGWTRRMFARRPDQQHRAARGAACGPAQPLQPARSMVDGEDVMPAINAVLARMESFVGRVRTRRVAAAIPGSPSPTWSTSASAAPTWGPRWSAPPSRPIRRDDLRVHFVSNVDGTHLAETVRDLDADHHALHRRLQDLHHPGDHDQRHAAPATGC